MSELGRSDLVGGGAIESDEVALGGATNFVVASVGSVREGLDIRYLDFPTEGDQIVDLRRQVFELEQGYGEVMNASPKDEEAIHLGAFYKGELVSCITAYVYKANDPVFEKLELQPPRRFAVQYSRRAERKEFRGLRLNEYLSSLLSKSIYETIRPDYIFLMMMGDTIRLQRHYALHFGFKAHRTIPLDHKRYVLVMLAQDDDIITHYQKVKKVVSLLSKRYKIFTPSLPNFLSGRHSDYITLDEFVEEENIYAAPLELQGELPRLASQARLIYAEQKEHLAATQFPEPPGKFLDVGCGPGVYLSKLARHEALKGYTFYGVDNCKEYLDYARVSHPNINWISSSAYNIRFGNAFFDVIHASLLLIHLTNIDLAIKEFHRLLKPGGVLYIVDINDETFVGPKVIKRMVEKHAEIYIGNRKMMDELPSIASQHRLKLERTHKTVCTNKGFEGDNSLENGTYNLGRNLMWSMFAFIGQVEDIYKYYQAAQNYYFSKIVGISIEIQTHVYRKVG